MNPAPLNNDQYRKQTFLKSCIVKDGAVTFHHDGRDYRVTASCLKSRNGQTVLVDTALNIQQGGKKIGDGIHESKN